jgi:toxin-antitoxin system PIN domain toxin
MIIPDTNLLIYANSPTSPFHAASRAWLERILSSVEPVGIPILSVYAFLRFFTNTSIHPKPATFHQASVIVDSWLALPHVRLLYPGDRHWELLQQIAVQVRLQGAQTIDAAIAAIAREYGGVVYTNDRDFARFPDARWVNPLQP